MSSLDEQLCLSAALLGVTLPLEPWHLADSYHRSIYVAAVSVGGGLAETFDAMRKAGTLAHNIQCRFGLHGTGAYLLELSWFWEWGELEFAAAADGVIRKAKRNALALALSRIEGRLYDDAIEAVDAWDEVRATCRAIGTSHTAGVVALLDSVPPPAAPRAFQVRTVQSRACEGSGMQRSDTAAPVVASKAGARVGSP